MAEVQRVERALEGVQTQEKEQERGREPEPERAPLILAASQVAPTKYCLGRQGAQVPRLYDLVERAWHSAYPRRAPVVAQAHFEIQAPQALAAAQGHSEQQAPQALVAAQAHLEQQMPGAAAVYEASALDAHALQASHAPFWAILGQAVATGCSAARPTVRTQRHSCTHHPEEWIRLCGKQSWPSYGLYARTRAAVQSLRGCGRPFAEAGDSPTRS